MVVFRRKRALRLSQSCPAAVCAVGGLLVDAGRELARHVSGTFSGLSGRQLTYAGHCESDAGGRGATEAAQAKDWWSDSVAGVAGRVR